MAPPFINRELKGTRSRLEQPRYHLSILGHPRQFINQFRKDRYQGENGLFARFLFSAPMPPYYTAAEIRNAPRTIVSVHCLLAFIRLVHWDRNRNYTFTDNAIQILDEKFNSYSSKVKKCNEFDSYIG